MTPTTHSAILASIKHWEENLAGSQEDASLGTNGCALCQLFFRYPEQGSPDCERNDQKCPIYEKTGKALCGDTPYIDVCNATNEAEFHAACQAEIDFLKSLLPENQS